MTLKEIAKKYAAARALASAARSKAREHDKRARKLLLALKEAAR